MLLIYEMSWKYMDFAFYAILIVASLAVRFICVFVFMALINPFLSDEKKVSYKNQFIMAYSGLRGAIALILSKVMFREVFSEEKYEKVGHMLDNATVMVLLFTVWIQGST